METINAILEVVNNLPVHLLALPVEPIHEPPADCGVISGLLNNEIVQKFWGWTKAIPVLGKYILVPILAVVLAMYWFGMKHAGNKILKVIMSAVVLTIVILILPGLTEGTNMFGSCG